MKIKIKIEFENYPHEQCLLCGYKLHKYVWFNYYENEDGPGLNFCCDWEQRPELNRLAKFLKTYPEYHEILFTKDKI